MKITKSTCIATWTFVVAAFACGVQADEAPDTKPDKSEFTAIDTNQDGQISASEAKENNGWLARNFTMVDKNSDGMVSKTEFEQALS